MSRVATIVLNRNLPDVTDRLCEQITKYDGDVTDLYVVEAGSDADKLSRYMSWHANWDEAMEHGLRYSRGMNYGLSQLWKNQRFAKYDFFFLLTNDTEFPKETVLGPLLEELDAHPLVGLLSPCSRNWGERLLLDERPTKYFWYIHNTAYLIRRSFVECIMESDDPNHLNFIFDGSNFRGYGAEQELLAKGYANDWAAAITTKVWTKENESYLLNKADLIKTEPYEQNLRLYVEEGKAWMRRKYGFNSRWTMQMYAKFMYEKFFEFHPELNAFKI